jgi:DNA-binding MarR family transcriptional regulator
VDHGPDSALSDVLLLLRETGQRTDAAIVERFGADLAPNAAIVVLASLAVHGALRPKDLLAATGLSGAGLTRTLQHLESGGLIDRRPNLAADRRGILVALTPRGRRMERSISSLIVATFTEARAELKAVLVTLGHDDAGRTTGVDSTSPSEVPLALASLGVRLAPALTRRRTDGTSLDSTAILGLIAIGRVGSCRPSYLSDVLCLSSAGTTRLLDRVDAAGLCSRTFGALSEDRRSVLVELTPGGLDVVREVIADIAASADLIRTTVEFVLTATAH